MDFARGSGALINVCLGLIINHIHVKRSSHVEYLKEKQIFAVGNGLFWPSFAASSVALLGIVCFGFVYEMWWRKNETEAEKNISVATRDSVVFLKRIATL